MKGKLGPLEEGEHYKNFIANPALSLHQRDYDLWNRYLVKYISQMCNSKIFIN